MPISNPIVNLTLTINNYGSNVLYASRDPDTIPDAIKRFWFNTETRKLWLSVGITAVSDWVQIEGNNKVLSAILVQNGQILTTDTEVIYQ